MSDPTIYSGLTQLGGRTEQPQSPEQAVLERVPNPHPGTQYLVRFAAPEFTSLCPITGQPDFAHLMIDYVPGDWLVESKSLKLYLNGYAMTRFDDAHVVRARIARDVAACTGGDIEVALRERSEFARLQVTDFAGEALDAQRLDITDYAPPRPRHLAVPPHARVVEEALVSDVFRSRCPVTGQPDWASVQVRYRGKSIDRAGLLRYLVSFRDHADFHEACVERIFSDVMARCMPQGLSVYARFLRRGDFRLVAGQPDFQVPDAAEHAAIGDGFDLARRNHGAAGSRVGVTFRRNCVHK